MPGTFSGTELFAAVSSRFVRVKYRVACVVSTPLARTARGPPGPVVIVMRPLPAVPSAVITSRLPKSTRAADNPSDRAPSDLASLSSD